MATKRSAPVIYPKNYSVIHTQKELKEIATAKYQGPTGFFHQLNELMQTPTRGFQWLLGKASEQRFDQTTRTKFNAIIIKSLAIVGLALVALIVAPFALIGILTAALKQKYLPPLRYVANVAKDGALPLPEFSKKNPLHLFQYNLGMGPNYKCLADGLVLEKISPYNC